MDLGNYTCQASNNLGKDRGSLTLSGIPTVCYFDSVILIFKNLEILRLLTNIYRKQLATIETDIT